MKLEIGMSTMNLKSIEDLNLKEKNIESDLLIINQVTEQISLINEEYFFNNYRIRVHSFREKGLAKSRNRAIQYASGDIFLIGDDDVFYKKNYKEKIIKNFENYSADVISFRAEDFNGNLLINYPKRMKKITRFSMCKAHSIVISFKLSSIKNNNILFDEMFGLGSIYESAEENIFLVDCLKKGLKVIFIPETIAIHPKNGSGRNFNKKALITKGAAFYRMYGNLSYLLLPIFGLKKRRYIAKHNISFWDSLKYFYEGVKEYKSTRK